MVVGEHVALAVDDEAGARRRTLAAGVDLDRDDAGQRHGGDVGDRTGWALRGAGPGFRQRRAGEVDAVLRELTGDAADDPGEQAQADHERGQPAAAAPRRAGSIGERDAAGWHGSSVWARLARGSVGHGADVCRVVAPRLRVRARVGRARRPGTRRVSRSGRRNGGRDRRCVGRPVGLLGRGVGPVAAPRGVGPRRDARSLRGVLTAEDVEPGVVPGRRRSRRPRGWRACRGGR